MLADADRVLAGLRAEQPTLTRWWVAYSGGCDSHVLLHWLARQRDRLSGCRLAVVHVNHGLHPDAEHWAVHCRQVCDALALPLTVFEVDARPGDGISPEAAARTARYQALSSLLDKHSVVLTAHHQRDQAETLLLQLLRGAGPQGLAAMPVSTRLAVGRLWRPLLNLSQQQLRGYADYHQLNWIDDPSNAETQADRNYLRHEILPRLTARWPAAETTLARSARWCGEAMMLTDTLATADLDQCREPAPDQLNITGLQQLDDRRRRNALRYWLRSLTIPLPDENRLQRIVVEAVDSADDRQPLIGWAGYELRRFGGRLYVLKALPDFKSDPVCWSEPDRPLTVPGIGQLMLVSQIEGPRLDIACVRSARLSIRFRQGGEQFRPVGDRHSRSLKKWLQTAKIPPWQRNRLPLLYLDDTLAAVADRVIDSRFAASDDQPGWVLQWQKAPASGIF